MLRRANLGLEAATQKNYYLVSVPTGGRETDHASRRPNGCVAELEEVRQVPQKGKTMARRRVPRNRTEPAGPRLKAVRLALGMTGRDVETCSGIIARTNGDRKYYISHSSLLAIENSSSAPGVHKLFTLSAVYRINFFDLLRIFDIDLDQLHTAPLDLRLPKTHLVSSAIYDKERRISLPVSLDSRVRIEDTNLLSRMVQRWDEVPIAFLQDLATQEYLYGFIGMDDYTLYPMIRPGAFVQINDHDTKIDEPELWENEFERPIYFFQLLDGYACGWCHLDNRVLTIVPHVLSPAKVRKFIYPEQIEIVGRVEAVATCLTTTGPFAFTSPRSRAS